MKLFDVRFFNVDPKTGKDKPGRNNGFKMNETPMTHHEACTFKSKMMDRGKSIVFRLVESVPTRLVKISREEFCTIHGFFLYDDETRTTGSQHVADNEDIHYDLLIDGDSVIRSTRSIDLNGEPCTYHYRYV